MEPSKAGYQMAAIHVTSLQTYEKKGNFFFRSLLSSLI